MKQTALITGGTSGIGAAFARKLASENYNLILVARDDERLKKTAAELEQNYQITVETISADLSTVDDTQQVASRLSDPHKPVDLLVNNAGMGLKGAFADIPEEKHQELVRLNIQSVITLTHATLNAMTKRGSGDILNISSTAAFLPGLRPASTYAATKAFVLTFTDGLATYLQGTGVRICAVCPGFVRTEFHERAGIQKSSSNDSSFLWMQPEVVVDAALKDLRAGKTISIAGKQYKALVFLTRLLPRVTIARLSRRFGS